MVEATQKTQVIITHTSCAPIDAIGSVDHDGCRKRIEYGPAVAKVQHDENLVSSASEHDEFDQLTEALHTPASDS